MVSYDFVSTKLPTVMDDCHEVKQDRYDQDDGLFGQVNSFIVVTKKAVHKIISVI